MGTHEGNGPVREGVLYVVEFELAFNNGYEPAMTQKNKEISLNVIFSSLVEATQRYSFHPFNDINQALKANFS